MLYARFFPNHPDPAGALKNDLLHGLRYLYDGQEHVFPWRTTYLELDAMPFIRRAPHDRFGWPVYRFEVILLLGALEISGLQVNVPNLQQSPAWRFDTPLYHFPFEIRLGSDGRENYWQVKDYLRSALGEPVRNWERADQLHASWNADGLELGLTYWFKSEISKTESGYASLNIDNGRLFPEYFTDAYTQAFSLDAPGLEMRTFRVANVSVPDFYRTSEWVRCTPQAVRDLLENSPADLAVWHDTTRRKMGFATNKLLCKIVEITEKQQFTLRTVDHDRGVYSQEILATRPDGLRETLVSANLGALSEVVLVLERAGFEVKREE